MPAGCATTPGTFPSGKLPSQSQAEPQAAAPGTTKPACRKQKAAHCNGHSPGSQYCGKCVSGSTNFETKKRNPAVVQARCDPFTSSLAISTTMAKILSAQRTISHWNPRSAIAELPRDSRKARIAETSVGSPLPGSLLILGARFDVDAGLRDADFRHLDAHLSQATGAM